MTESLAKLAEAEDKFKVLSVMHDMTKKEREECKQLVAEAKQRQDNDESGEYVYRVRGALRDMKILRIKKCQQQRPQEEDVSNLQAAASGRN